MSETRRHIREDGGAAHCEGEKTGRYSLHFAELAAVEAGSVDSSLALEDQLLAGERKVGAGAAVDNPALRLAILLCSQMLAQVG